MSDDLDTAIAMKGMLAATRQKICLAMAYSHKSRRLAHCHRLLVNLRNDLDVVIHLIEQEYEKILDEAHRSPYNKPSEVRSEQGR